MRVLYLLTFLMVIASCGQKPTGTGSKKEESKADTVGVFILKPDSVRKVISLPGDLLANEGIQVRSKVQGYITGLKVDIGSMVHKGQVLALVDAPELLARVRAAESRYRSSKDYYERINSASKTSGVVALSELEKSRNQMLADEAEYKATIIGETSYKQIDNYLAILSPFDGIITRRNVNIGSFVGSANEKPLFEIEDARVLRLSVNVPEIYTGAELVGGTAEITIRSLPDKKFQVKLVRKSGNIDVNSRSERWEFELQNPDHILKSGSYADVKLRLMRTKPSFIVPVSAVVTTLEKKFVIQVKKGLTKWVDVRSGFNLDTYQEIFGDLNPGDTLVIKGNEELKANKKVVTRY